MSDQFSDDSIFIRRYQYSDIDLLYEAARESIEKVSIWLPWCHPDYSKRETIEWITYQMSAWDDGREYSFGIFDKQTEKFIGGCGLNQLDFNNKLANLGYWIRTSYTNRGIATRAAQLAACFGFEELKLNRIEILMTTRNIASRRIAEKLGAKQEGILRNRIFLYGQPYDAFLFSLIPSDLNK